MIPRCTLCLHKYNKNCHSQIEETVPCKSAAETSEWIIATETVTCMIATERSTKITVTESTTCIIAIESVSYIVPTETATSRIDYIPKLSLPEMVPVQDYNKEIEPMSKHQV